jgi:hypothetical protein
MSPMTITPRARQMGLEEFLVRDLMTPNPVAFRHGISVRRAAASGGPGNRRGPRPE